MKQVTRKWLSNLIVNKNNSKAIEIRDYIDHLESELKKVIDETQTQSLAQIKAETLLKVGKKYEKGGLELKYSAFAISQNLQAEAQYIIEKEAYK